MKRHGIAAAVAADAAAVASPSSPPGPTRHTRLRYGHPVISSAVLALARREYTEQALQQHLQALYPTIQIVVADLLVQLQQYRYVTTVQDTLTLTEHGDDAAAIAESRAAQMARIVPHTKYGSVVDPQWCRLMDSCDHASMATLSLLTRGQVHVAASRADLAPPPPRAGSLDHERHPSRFGNRLHYRDGRVVDAQGLTNRQGEPTGWPLTTEACEAGRIGSR